MWPWPACLTPAPEPVCTTAPRMEVRAVGLAVDVSREDQVIRMVEVTLPLMQTWSLY